MNAICHVNQKREEKTQQIVINVLMNRVRLATGYTLFFVKSLEKDVKKCPTCSAETDHDPVPQSK